MCSNSSTNCKTVYVTSMLNFNLLFTEQENNKLTKSKAVHKITDHAVPQTAVNASVAKRWV